MEEIAKQQNSDVSDNQSNTESYHSQTPVQSSNDENGPHFNYIVIGPECSNYKDDLFDFLHE
jgi:hypothetical protein